LVEQFRQNLFDGRLPLLRRHLQDPHVLPVGTPRLLRLQRVIGPPKRHRRVQVLPVHVACERPRLPHQPVDHVPIIDAVFRLAPQPLHRLDQRTRVPNRDDLGADARFHPLPHQPRRHRVDILLHLNGAALAHPRPLTLQCLQSSWRQRTQPCLLRLKRLGPAGIPPILQSTHELPVFLPTGEVTAATQQ
jgi:hypothetical protein